MADSAMLKGSVMRDPRDWVRAAYGEESYQKSLATLNDAERKIVDGQLLASAWYPIGAWDHFLAAARAEAKRTKSESEDAFDMRNMREAGSKVTRTVYKFMLGLLKPKSVIDRVPSLLQRIYSVGTFAIVTNDPGRAVLRYSGAPEMQENLSHMFASCVHFLLELNGAANIERTVVRNTIDGGQLVFEIEVRYAVKT
jgi:hypothetical protein